MAKDDATLILSQVELETLKGALNTASVYYHERSQTHTEEGIRHVNAQFRDEANALWLVVMKAAQAVREQSEINHNDAEFSDVNQL